MPPISNINIGFLRAVFMDEKKLLKNLQVKRVDVPKYPELAVHKILEDIKHDEELMLYIPT